MSQANISPNSARLKLTPVPDALKAAPIKRASRGETLINLMQAEAGASAAELAEAVGWQVHSVRGFIAGTLKKRNDLRVEATRIDGVTRYRVQTVGV